MAQQFEEEDPNVRRVYNFSAGPGELPKPVLKKAQEEMLDWNGTGHSVMELSHRSQHFISIAENARLALRELLQVPENFKIFFFQGGATNQFAAICYNLLGDSEATQNANYLTTGYWTEQAIAEAKKYCTPNEVASSVDINWKTVPQPETWNIDPSGQFFHYCDNETIQGVEYNDFPYENVPENMTIVADMSSNIATKKLNWDRLGVVYAGASKNLGPAGATIVIIRKDLIPGHMKQTPILCDWDLFSNAQNTFLNTPPCWTIYMCGLNFQYMLQKGGLEFYEKETAEKAKMLYEYMDSTEGYYINDVDPTYRSRVNIPFSICNNVEMETKFAKDAIAADLTDLAGHPLVGKCRASIYCPMPIEGVRKLVQFMKEWKEANPATNFSSNTN